MSVQPGKPDHDARRVSKDAAQRHKAEIDEIARKNEAVQRDGMKLRRDAERQKADIRRAADR